MTGTLDFDEFVDLLRRRLGAANAANPGEAPDFEELMKDYKTVTPPQWYHEALDELEALGHLDMNASGKTGGGEAGHAHGKLSADGRYYLRHEDADS